MTSPLFFPSASAAVIHRAARAALIAVVVAAPIAPAAAQDISAGEQLYRSNCADCHGRSGEQRSLGKSRPIRELDAEEIRKALIERRSLQGQLSMQDRVKAALTNPEVDALADYVSSLE
ncbi:c-type cytochrome [Consotaella aegiceratis]|uniref:c-type cytochrome n=1 Tax=Consotaella aegiceratis TaxID=3097961 RepID=UPI002F3FA246